MPLLNKTIFQIWNTKRQNARYRGIEFSLTPEDIPWPIPAECPQWHLPLADYPARNRPCLDRINNELGYVPGNVQWLCMGANSSKGSRQEAKPL